jgi:hypothetical protein
LNKASAVRRGVGVALALFIGVPIVVICALVALFFVRSEVTQPTPPALVTTPNLFPTFGSSKTTSLEVRGDTPWTDTHVHVLPGQRISIIATGFIQITDRSFPGFAMESPDGQPMGQIQPRDKNVRNFFPAPNLAAWSLIGRIGNSNLFHVGSQGTFVAEREGELFLGVNAYQFAGCGGGWQTVLTVEAPIANPSR